jgi:gas vesicle protein
MKKLNVEVQSDLIEKLSKASPIQALSELIWNAFDADANTVNVFLEHDKLNFLSKISIKDDGVGFSPEEAEHLFEKLGGSWKKNAAKTKNEGRYLHGKEGRGRFKAFALGRIGKWNVVYKKGKKFYEFNITIIRDNIKEVIISDETVSTEKKSGVTVEITEIDKNFKSLDLDTANQSLAEIYALYLKNYHHIKLVYESYKVDPTPLILASTLKPLSNIRDENGKLHPVELEIIEWKKLTKRTLYLSSEKGFPYAPLEGNRFHTGRYNFSAYLKSSFIDDLYQNNILEVGSLTPELNKSVDEAQKAIKEYFLSKSADEAKSVVDKWKEENVYPYSSEPKSKVEEVERQIFDIVAVNINENLPEFSETPKKSKKLNLSLLKHAIERNPEDLEIILSEILSLSKTKQKELAQLLKNTTLSAIINASKLVTDRLRFLEGVEEIIFDTEMKQYLKERAQLHQILKDNTWIFGEEFALSLSDQSLTEVLNKHKKLLGEKAVIDKPVKRIDGSTGIVDLMLSRQIKTNRKEELEHLIIEFKAPKVKLSPTECTQIKSYAFAIAEDERFKNIKTKWTFYLISNDMDKVVSKEVHQDNRPEGILYQSNRGENPEITIWVKTWSQIIHENKARLEFIKEKLEYQADKGQALKHLKEAYSALLDGTKVGEKIDGIISEQEIPYTDLETNASLGITIEDDSGVF